jgi:hypothetical protein
VNDKSALRGKVKGFYSRLLPTDVSHAIPDLGSRIGDNGEMIHEISQLERFTT